MNFKIPLVIYPYNVLFYFGEDLKGFCKTKKIEYKWKEVDDQTEGLTLFTDSDIVIISMDYVPTDSHGYSVLQHEIFHAVSFTLRSVGINLTEDTEEAYAYLIDYLTKQCYTKLKFNEICSF